MALRPIPNEQRPKPIARVPITEGEGKPSPFFARQWQNLVNLVTSVIELQDDSETNAARIAAIEDTEVLGGTGLSGGGKIGDGNITISANVQEILDSISSTHGAVLFRGSASWQALGPGAADYVLATKGAGADPEWVVQSGGGGGGPGGGPAPWELIATVPVVSGSSVDFTNLDAFEDLMVVTEDVTRSASGQLLVRCSVDNGATFYAVAGDYVRLDTNGVETNTSGIALDANATAARSAYALILATGVSGVPKTAQGNRGSYRFVASTSPVNALRVILSSGATFTGGTIYLLGRRSGGGGGSAFFAGATGALENVGSSTAFATKGIVFVPQVNMTVTHVWAQITAAAPSNMYYAQIAELSSLTRSSPDTNYVAGLVVGGVVASSPSVAAGATYAKLLRLKLTAPAALTAGTPYVIVLVFDQGSGTAPSRVATGGSSSAETFTMNAPGETLTGGVQFNTVGLSPGQVASALGLGGTYYQISIEGTL